MSHYPPAMRPTLGSPTPRLQAFPPADPVFKGYVHSCWEDLPEPRRFLAALLRKAELRDDAWPSGAEVWRYTVRDAG